MHCRVTANVCVPTVYSTHTVSYKTRRWVTMKVVCKLNDCNGRKSSVRQCRCAVAKRLHQLTLLNFYLATCFAAGVHRKLQLLKVIFKKIIFCIR